MLAENSWTALSIPKGASQVHNREKFSEPKERGHFTDEFLPMPEKLMTKKRK
jgi:hypothetical protein